jgi:magnesium chelatase subunit D
VTTAPSATDPGADERLAAVLLALDPVGLGGVRLHGAADARRDAWLALLRAALPSGTPWLRMPGHIDDDRLLGGLDLGATLQRGQVVVQPGLLARCDGGLLLAAMAERLSPATAARLAAVLDTRRVPALRGVNAPEQTARLGVVALDEGQAGEEAPPAALLDRLGLQVDLSRLPAGVFETTNPPWDPDALAAARARLPTVQCEHTFVQVLCEAADALGVASLRAPLFALAAARAHAAWFGRVDVQADDCAAAARLVLAPRATRLPAPPEEDTQDERPPEPPTPEPPQDNPPPDSSEDERSAPPDDQALQEQVLAAALAALPPDLLAQLAAAAGKGTSAGGRAGALQKSRLRGRPYGSRRGDPRQGARLHLIDTLRAAAPWQGLRRRDAAGPAGGPCVMVRREDFHVSRFRQRRETVTLFVVDASGSAALHRLAEAKGAVELLLADCYVRRDKVALMAFRGSIGADLLLPPTRSLVRAKRCLASLPGGGGTPLAAALDAARQLTEEVVRRGGTPLAVFLTDGRANIARDGSGGRERAQADAMAAARLWRASGVGALWLDTAPQPQAQARELAQAMGARYLPLPHADARQMSRAVTALR